MNAVAPQPRILLLGIGNSLLSDDGAGVHVVDALSRNPAFAGSAELSFRDGGTIGLSLLTEIEDHDALIVVDAMQLGKTPGTVATFTGAAMDRQLAGVKSTAHEVALADLMGAAALAGCCPENRALVGIQPEKLTWGLEPTSAVAAAIPIACDAVRSLVNLWAMEHA